MGNIPPTNSEGLPLPRANDLHIPHGYHRCNITVVGATIGRPKTNDLHNLHGYGCPPTLVGAIHESSQNERFAQFLWMRPCEHIPLNIAHYSAFFLKKDGTKKDFTVFRYAETGECFALPGLKRRLYFRRAEVGEALPGFRCPRHPRGGLRHICRFVCVTKCGQAIFSRIPLARARSDIGDVILRLSCSRFVCPTL